MIDIDTLIAFENGELNTEEVAAFFQPMIDSGLVWTLQGFYGRTARDLIEAGLCAPAKGAP